MSATLTPCAKAQGGDTSFWLLNIVNPVVSGWKSFLRGPWKYGTVRNLRTTVRVSDCYCEKSPNNCENFRVTYPQTNLCTTASKKWAKILKDEAKISPHINSEVLTVKSDPVERIKAISAQALSKRAQQNALAAYPQRVAKARRTQDPSGLQVSMEATLTNAAHRLTLIEKRIIMLAVAKIDSRKNVNRDEDLMITVTAVEFAKLHNIALNTAYEALDEAVKKLYDRTIGFAVPDKDGVHGLDERWITGKEYHTGEGWVEVHINKRILKYLTGLYGTFVKYKLEQTSALRSIYSWRLLELLTQFEKTGWRQLNLDEFVFSMGAKDTYAKNFAQLRRWVIEPAIRELTEKDGWHIEWKPIKTGRKVTSLRFDFKRSPQRKLML